MQHRCTNYFARNDLVLFPCLIRKGMTSHLQSSTISNRLALVVAPRPRQMPAAVRLAAWLQAVGPPKFHRRNSRVQLAGGNSATQHLGRCLQYLINKETCWCSSGKPIVRHNMAQHQELLLESWGLGNCQPWGILSLLHSFERPYGKRLVTIAVPARGCPTRSMVGYHKTKGCQLPITLEMLNYLYLDPRWLGTFTVVTMITYWP